MPLFSCLTLLPHESYFIDLCFLGDEKDSAKSKSQSSQFRQVQANAMAQVLTSLVSQRLEADRTLLNRVVAFEGNIGAGKSTLCGKFKSIYPDKCSLYKEQGNEKFLRLFYSNPVRSCRRLCCRWSVVGVWLECG